MSYKSLYAASIGLGILFLATAGCAGPVDGRVIVSGVVSFEQKPVTIGQIRFIPEKGTKGPVTISIINDGYYSSKATGGVPVGHHRVEILSFDPEEYETHVGPGVPPPKQFLPPKYNSKSTLQASVGNESSTKTLDYSLDP